LNKISGPLLDRIDLHVEVTPVSFDELTASQVNEKSEQIRVRVIEAREIQTKRFEGSKDVHSNARMSNRQLQEICRIDGEGRLLLKTAMERLGLSARASDRILKVARTIADLEKCKEISSGHLAEAIQYRSLDREGWAGWAASG
jgi:magnesium chelatase family protein